MMHNYILVQIQGKNPKRYLKEFRQKGISLYDITYKGKDIYVKILKEDYEKIKEFKTQYKFPIIKRYGIDSLFYTIRYHLVFLICCVLGYGILLLLSNLIFSITVVHNDASLRNLIVKELKHYGVSRYHPFVSYSKKEKILERIKENHKDRIEWIEMTRDGVRYVVNVEERIQKENQNSNALQNIVAKKKGIIKKIQAKEGEVVKRVNDYVNPGDIIISGNITKNEKVKAQTRADGVVYAETWYVSKVRMPLKYKNEKYSGKKRYILKLYWDML